jgi:hypothetical protein
MQVCCHRACSGFEKNFAGKWGHRRRSSHSAVQTSVQELALAKPLKHSSKLATKSSGLSVAERAFVAGVKTGSKKMSSSFTDGSGMTPALTHALNLFDLDSSASDDENAPPEPPWKHLRGSPRPKDMPKSSATKGTFE